MWKQILSNYTIPIICRYTLLLWRYQKTRISQKKSSELSETDVSETNIEKSVADEDSAFRIHQVLHYLEEPYKEVFQLRVFGELSFQKIGQLFEKTENWACVTYHRARLKIQERMEEL